MLTGVLISAISSAVFSMILLVFAFLIRRRYAKLLPYYLQQAADTVIDNLKGIKTGGLDRVPAITAAFRNLNYEPLQRRWNQCLRDFAEIGNSRAFLDVDETFKIEPVMDETLERATAQGAERWIQAGGVLSFCTITAIGFLLDNAAEQGVQAVFTVFGMAFSVLAVSFLISIAYHIYDGRSTQAAFDSYTGMLTRLKECLPPVGRNNLIQTMYLMQAEQYKDLQEQTLQMKLALESFAITTLSATIGSRFDDAVSTYLAPPIKKMADTQDVLLHRLLVDQHKRMDQLFTLFTTQVGGLLSQQLEGMAGSVSGASKGMLEITTALHSVSEAVSTTLVQNRETTSRNSALLSELAATHERLVERFSEATILLDDILTSSKILADTTTNANLSTIELSETAVRLHKESGEKYDLLNKSTGEKFDQLCQVTGEKFDQLNQATGEKFDLLRTTLDDRMTASTTAALALQGSLTAHAEEIRNGLGEYSSSVKDSMGAHSTSVRDSMGAYSEMVRSSLADYSTSVRDSIGEHAISLKNSLDGYTSGMHGTFGEYSSSLRLSFEEFTTGLQRTLEEQTSLAARQQKEQAETAVLQFTEQAEQATLQQRVQAEQATLQQREQAEQATLQQREQAEQANRLQREQAEQANLQQREQAEKANRMQVEQAEQIAQRQKELAEQITVRQAELAEQLNQQQREMSDKLFGALFANVREMEDHTIGTLQQAQAWSLEVSRTFTESANTLFEKIKIQNQDLSQEIQAQGRSNTNMLITTNKTLVDSSALQNKLLAEHSSKLLNAMRADAESLVQSIHQESAGLLQVLPTQMREAFNAFTSSMGETMRSTLTDSVEIIDRLGKKTEELHSEFELYFSRTEGNTDKLVDDLRFAMEGAIGKFTEMSGESLNLLRDGNTEAMTAFAEQTRQLMDAVDEQTRTISLYVKDMGIDMGELNKGLKSSVSEFTSQLQAGVGYTFKEFDTGLAEIVRRMTELGISIEESVQALPETIGRLNQGKN